jgi:hypothetical protein
VVTLLVVQRVRGGEWPVSATTTARFWSCGTSVPFETSKVQNVGARLSHNFILLR